MKIRFGAGSFAIAVGPDPVQIKANYTDFGSSHRPIGPDGIFRLGQNLKLNLVGPGFTQFGPLSGFNYSSDGVHPSSRTVIIRYKKKKKGNSIHDSASDGP